MVPNIEIIQGQFLYAAVAIIAIWLIALTVLLVQMLNHYRNLTKNIVKKDLKTILDEIMKDKKIQIEGTNELRKKLEELGKDSLYHLQKIGFLRFNPFSDTGGDQSFILSLLDNKDNGIVFSSLHGRGTTRLYVKKVLLGKGDDFELSDEEKKVIKQAKKLK